MASPVVCGARGQFPGQRGQVLIMTAFSMTVLLAITALSIDGSFMYDKRNRLYAAADAAAKSGAIEVHRNAAVTLASLQNFANQQVVANGFNPSGATSVVVHHPPTSGPYSGNANYVEAIVSEPTPTFFGRVLGRLSLTPGGRAVAGTSSGIYCLITLGTAPAGISIGNNTTINMSGCNIADGGNLNLNNNASVIADEVAVTGAYDGGGAVSPSPQVSAPAPVDPFATLAAPSDPGGTCSAPLDIPSLSGAPISPGKYCGWDFQSSSVLNLNPGIYYITGPISDKNSGTDVTIKCAATNCSSGGVMIYLAPGGSLDLDSNRLVINLKGMTNPASVYYGMVFYQNRTNANDAVFGKNGGTVTLDGALYAPAALLTMKNNGLSASPCTVIVAKGLDMKNNGSLGFDNTCADFGGGPIFTVSLAE